MTRDRSAIDTPFAASASRITSGNLRTAWVNTYRPFILGKWRPASSISWLKRGCSMEEGPSHIKSFAYFPSA